jgi:hypothetical protein
LKDYEDAVFRRLVSVTKITGDSGRGLWHTRLV